MKNALDHANDWIISFPVNNPNLTIKDFVSQFHDEEIDAMREYNEDTNDIVYEDLDEDDLNYCIIIDYIKDWLIDNIRNDIVRDTRKLFELYCMF